MYSMHIPPSSDRIGMRIGNGSARIVDDSSESIGKTWSSKKISEELQKKLDKPNQNGSEGQVLTADGNGGVYWGTVSGGAGSFSPESLAGNGLTVSDGKLQIDVATEVSEDDQRPVTSAAVYELIADIAYLLYEI